MEAKEIPDKEILTKGMGKGFNGASNLQSSLPEHEMDFPSLEYSLTWHRVVGSAQELWVRLVLAGVMQVVSQGDRNGILYLWSYFLKFSVFRFGSVCNVVVVDSIFFLAAFFLFTPN